MEPRDEAGDAEHAVAPAGTDERFVGFGVMGLPFSSGHLLALRRFPVSTVVPAYSAVWLRDPAGVWTIAATSPPEQSCSRYFGDAVERKIDADVGIEWTDGWSLRVSVDGGLDLDWTMHLRSTPLTEAMSAACTALPDAIWRKGWFSTAMGGMAEASLRAGTMRLMGGTPNRQRFVLRPRRLWLIDQSTARLGGEDLGHPQPLAGQAALADFWLPQRGLFMAGWTAFAPE